MQFLRTKCGGIQIGTIPTGRCISYTVAFQVVTGFFRTWTRAYLENRGPFSSYFRNRHCATTNRRQSASRRNTRPWRNNGDCSFLVNQGNSFRPQCIWDPYLERPSRVFPFLLFSFSLAYPCALRKKALTDPGCLHWPKLGSNSILFGLWTARWSIGQWSDSSNENERRSDLREVLANITCISCSPLFSLNQYSNFKQANFILDLNTNLAKGEQRFITVNNCK